MNIKIAGILATIILIISFFPVLYVIFKTKKTNNFPYYTLILALISNLLWIYDSFSEYPKIRAETAFMGVLYFLIYTFILLVKIIY